MQDNCLKYHQITLALLELVVNTVRQRERFSFFQFKVE